MASLLHVFCAVVSFAISNSEAFKLQPFGYKSCMRSCLSLSNCHFLKFSKTSLKCESVVIIPRKRQQDSVYLNLRGEKRPCSHHRPSRYIKTRRKGSKCVSPSRRQLKDKLEQKHLPTFTVKLRKSPTEFSLKNNITIVFATTMFSASGKGTQIFKLSLVKGEQKSLGIFKGGLVNMDVDKSVLYWCQKGPISIHRYHLDSGDMSFLNTSLLDEICHCIAGDTSQNYVFFATADFVTRYSPDIHRRKLLNITSRVNTYKTASMMKMFLDRKERIVYICRGKNRLIFWSGYDLTKKRSLESPQRSVVFSISIDGHFYYTTGDGFILRHGEIVSKPWTRMKFKKTKAKFHEKIKKVVVIGDVVLLEFKTTFRVFRSKDFKEIDIPKKSSILDVHRTHHLSALN